MNTTDTTFTLAPRRDVFSQAHDDYRAVVRTYLEEEVVPVYDSWAAEGRPSREFWARAGELGMLGVGVPPELGGRRDTDFRDSVVVTEEIQRLGLAIGGLRVQTDICMPYLMDHATDEQRRRWLPRLTSGQAVIALGMSEPGAGSDIKSMSTKAVRDGDHYVVNGAKTFISNGFSADLIILAVKTKPDAGRGGISLLVVETSTDGFERGRKLDKLGLQTQDLAELSFTNMRVPVENLLGDENAGFSYLTSHLAQERLSIAINSQAAASAALDWTVEAVQGTSPTQSVKFALAECATEVAAGQALADQALTLLVDNELTGAHAACVKLYCTELQSRVVSKCLDVTPGAASYRASSRIGRAYLDGRVSRIYGGSSEIMKVIVAQQLGL
jgi:long-chain-acyl-CoA dehydrogenase